MSELTKALNINIDELKAKVDGAKLFIKKGTPYAFVGILFNIEDGGQKKMINQFLKTTKFNLVDFDGDDGKEKLGNVFKEVGKQLTQFLINNKVNMKGLYISVDIATLGKGSDIVMLLKKTN